MRRWSAVSFGSCSQLQDSMGSYASEVSALKLGIVAVANVAKKGEERLNKLFLAGC